MRRWTLAARLRASLNGLTNSGSSNFQDAVFTPGKPLLERHNNYNHKAVAEIDVDATPTAAHSKRTLHESVPPSPATVKPLLRFNTTQLPSKSDLSAAPAAPSLVTESSKPVVEDSLPQTATAIASSAIIRDSSTFGTTFRPLKVPVYTVFKAPSEDDDDDSVIHQQPVLIAKPSAQFKQISSTSNVKETIAASLPSVTEQPVKRQIVVERDESKQQRSRHNDASASDPSPLKRARLMGPEPEVETQPVLKGTTDMQAESASITAGKDYEVRADDFSPAQTATTIASIIVPPTEKRVAHVEPIVTVAPTSSVVTKEENAAMKNLKGKLATLIKKKERGTSGNSNAENARSVSSGSEKDSIFGRISQESQATTKTTPPIAILPPKQTILPSMAPSLQSMEEPISRPTTRNQAKAANKEPTVEAPQTRVEQSKPLPIPTPSIQTSIDSDGDVDMSIEEFKITLPPDEETGEEIAFDSIDPMKEIRGAKVLVLNTQKPDFVAFNDDEDEEMDESSTDEIPKTPGVEKNAKSVVVKGRGKDVGATQTGSMNGNMTGTDGNQTWVGKVLSGISSFLPSPSKPQSTIAPPTPSVSQIPKPIVPIISTSQPTEPVVATTRLALKKDAGQRARELAKKRAEEKRALAAKELEEANQRKEMEEKKAKEERELKEIMEAAKRIPAIKPKIAVPEPKKVPISEPSDDDMELCSQTIPHPGEGKPKSKLLVTKLPMASSAHATSAAEPSSQSVTDFAVPMAATKNLKEPTLDIATPKALPRHNPATKSTHLQSKSILKTATPSFDVKLAERIKEGLVAPEPPVIIAKSGASKYGSGGSNSILSGLYEDLGGKKGSASSSLSSDSGKGKKNSGPATIVDENGELPEIADSDEGENSSDDDEEEEGQIAKTPAAPKPEPKKSAVPAWVETPNLMKTLTQQVAKDPDAIFGSVKPLLLEDVFKGAKSRRFRDSMAGNWVGNGELTKEEEEEYKREMGFK
ncbi:hypothetical protein HDU99_002891 [Rhizoclosmatium hyalinum]|nr:hypothetical protein HDU99_002891 [Rhizoclosmatium hyalinum]